MSDCDKTINVSYPNEEPCEQISAGCVLTEEAISYLSVEQGDPITEVVAKITQSLMDSRARLKNAEDRLAIEESLSNAISFVTPSLTTATGTTEQTLMPTIVGDKTFDSDLRAEGKAYEIEVEGRLTSTGSINSSIFNVKMGTTTILSLYSKDSGLSGTDMPFKIKVTLLFKATSIFAYGVLDTTNIYYFESSDITVDNSLAENLDVTFTGLTTTDSTTASVKLKSI